MSRSLVDAVHYASELQSNARTLLDDAHLLFDHGRWARALALAVLAEEEAGKALIAIAEQLPGDEFSDLRPTRHEDKLTATALTEIAFLGDLRKFQQDAERIDTGALHREKLAALYVDQWPAGIQSPASITPARAAEALSRTEELIEWISARLAQVTPEAVDVAIQLNAVLTAKMEEYFEQHGAAAGLELVRAFVEWGFSQTASEAATTSHSPPEAPPPFVNLTESVADGDRLSPHPAGLMSPTNESLEVNTDGLEEVAALLKQRNKIDEQIASIIERPMTSGHLGEWIAARIFDIELEASATAAGIDGRFRSGALAGKSVNVKWYLKHEGLLDIAKSGAPDYYLVFTGPRTQAASSRRTHRPWTIREVFLVDAAALMRELRARGVAIGAATSVRRSTWQAAEIYPTAANTVLPLNDEQHNRLQLFTMQPNTR